ncbi:MAG: HDOD domain-containing protein [Desulfovibrionaceae bacterium]|nr:HDOD domain-containing protein [Desulfovibrionaceae bacterium]MBF0514925.1 HDOD domain-containing protein [Desulfovibrionaceae bacterium]
MADIPETGRDEAAPGAVPDAAHGAALDAARALQARRFAGIDLSHPAAAALFTAGIGRLAALLAAEPRLFEKDAPAGTTSHKIGAPPKFIHEIVPPPPPDVFFKLQRVLADENTTNEDIAGIVSADPGLTGFLLRMVNSVYYGFPDKIDTVSRAVSLLGRREIFSHAAARAVSEVYRDMPPRRYLNMRRFWRHSLACGLFCRAASLAAGVGDPERYFVAGLLHDIGKPQLLLALPAASETAVEAARMENVHQSLAEQRLFGYDHGEVAGMVFAKWNFPEELTDAVSHHHHPERAQGSHKTAMVHAADFAVVALGISVDPRAHMPPFSPEAWETAGLGPEPLLELLNAVETHLDDFVAMFSAG